MGVLPQEVLQNSKLEKEEKEGKKGQEKREGAKC